MKLLTKPIVILFIFGVLFSSCRKEEMESIQAPEEDVLEASSAVANLMQRTAINDGSDDNIIDNSNCFDVQFPITVIVNGEEININNDDDLDTIEDIFDEYDDDNDTLEIIFPITIVLSDFTEVVINNNDELLVYSSTCNGEDDEDIECLDFIYPITANIFNTNSELIDVITLLNDNDLYDFINDIDENDIITINFPITVILSDGNQLTINSLTELATTIANAEDTCDEDDDNDYNDDDCDNCTTDQLTDILTGCSDWKVDKLERNNNDLEDNYTGYTFNFFNDNTISVSWASTTVYGTWQASGSGNAITVDIDIPALPDCNNVWMLHEIDVDSDETDIDLRLGDDRLKYESDCSTESVDDTELVQSLTTGDWYITYFFDDTDETSDFYNYTFNFASNGSATATDGGGPTNGYWSTSSGDETALELNLNFGTTDPLGELAEDWDVLEVTNDIIRLKDLSGGDGSTDYLTFERTQGGSGNDLASILSDGLWIVSSYVEDSDNQTGDYAGYELNFNSAGTVVADNGSNPNNGTWAVISSGNQLILNFGSSNPFSELNDDDWDVLSVTDTQVTVQDVSGGNGGTDTLILTKL